MNKLILGDCIDELRKMPDESVDVVITDPPYGINYVSNWYKEKNPFSKIVNDDKLFLPLDELLRVVKEDGVVFSFFSQKKPIADCRVKDVLIWVKNNWSAGDLTGSFGNQYEPIAFIPKEGFKLKTFRLSNVIFEKRVLPKYHPTEKPTAVIEHLLEASTKEGDTVLDPFMGGGSTGVACAKLKRNFIGIEIDENYFKNAEKRLNEWSGQERL